MNRNGEDARAREILNDDEDVTRKRRRNDAAPTSSEGRGFDRDNRSGRGRDCRRGRGGGGRTRHGDRGGQRRGNDNFARGRGSGGRTDRNRGDHRGGRRMPNDGYGRRNDRRDPKQSKNSFRTEDAAVGVAAATVVTASSSAASSLENESDANNVGKAAAETTNRRKDRDGDETSTVAAVLPWPDPRAHYVPLEEEERLLPALIHWGKSERGMMKDQPPFRLEKLRRALEGDRKGGGGGPSRHANGKRKDDNSHPREGRKRVGRKRDRRNEGDGRNEKDDRGPLHSSSDRQISLIQSLSLRRHHLKLLNPRFSMSALRLGKEEHIRRSAALFESCVDAYLRSHGVEFWTEEDQREKFERSAIGVPIYQRKQPPTPDFMMKEGHCVGLSFAPDGGPNDRAESDRSSNATHPTSVHWIEAKMFYGASSIPSGTPNAVGCILPKVRDYVRLYGTGAIVFMYGCGSRLATQLSDEGVVALDGRGLDLAGVESHQRGWCADSWGNILF